MKVNGLSKETKEKVIQLMEKTEDKNDAVFQAINMVVEAQNDELIQQILAESSRASQDADYAKTLGLRSLNKNETQFYEAFKDVKQAITAEQIDIIPNEIVDRTLDDVKKASAILSLVNFAPANVKKWIVASKTGTAVWGDLTDKIAGELSATVTTLNIELSKLTAYLIIPKAIRELSLPFVDKYFRAILSEAMQDGLVTGYLNGDGKTGPIGITRQIAVTDTDGTNKAKDIVATITKLSPKGLAPVRKTLTKGGLRVVSGLYLICNPSDEAEYVDPAMFGEVLTGGYVNKSFIPITKVVDANVPAGQAIFTIPNAYVMGTSGITVSDYNQTLAMDDNDVVIAKCYANGRALDDSTAVVFDVTKLQEYKVSIVQDGAEASIKALTDAVNAIKTVVTPAA